MENTSDDLSKSKRIKKNYFYNLFYQIFLLITPLITTPYISRTLLADGVGQYSFSMSLISYFTIFASLGFGYCAQREIAKHQGDTQRQTLIFWEINICRLIPVGIALTTNLALCAFGVYGDYNLLMWVLNINILNVAVDINFFYQGNEKFASILVRNTLIRIVAIASVFLFVKKQNDVWLYALINSLSLFLSTMAMWIPLRKLIVKVNFKNLKPLRYMKSALILFLPTIAVSIYTVLDKTLIGLLISDTYTLINEEGVEVVKKYSDLENGFYEQSEKIIKMVMTVITAIGIVMVPRNTNEVARGNHDQIKKNIYATSAFVLFLGVPMALGLASVADMFVPWFFGTGFEKSALLIKIMCALVVIIGLSNVFGMQFLIPYGRDKEFTFALIVGSATNIVLNIILINFFWSVGAAVATIVAELAVTVTMAILIRRDISVFKILLHGWKYYVGGAVMFVSLFFISKLFEPTIWMTILVVIIGIAIYLVVLLLLRDQLLLSYLHKLLRLKRGRKNETTDQ